MSRTLPEIRIIDAWLLRQNASEPLNQLWGDGQPLQTDDEYADIVKSYQEAWEPYGNKALAGMCEAVNLTFRKNVIDAHIAPWFGAFSEPLILGVRNSPYNFVNALTHELIHILLLDNTTVPYGTPLIKPWQKLFGSTHSSDTLIHIPVHAVHQHVYLDVLNEPDRLVSDMTFAKRNKANPAYLNAWDYVQKHCYQNINSELKNSYTALAQKFS
jgi:hypothetical protein